MNVEFKDGSQKMNVDNVTLPCNRKFGFFFSAIFLAACAYFYISGVLGAVYVFAFLSACFLFVTTFKSDSLLPLNKAWMRFGFLLGMIVSPIVLGLIFFGLFTPLAFFMRLSGRDELRLKFTQKNSHWITRTVQSEQADSFQHQF